jgi:FtsZ-binding cell division protein ZapB
MNKEIEKLKKENKKLLEEKKNKEELDKLRKENYKLKNPIKANLLNSMGNFGKQQGRKNCNQKNPFNIKSSDLF